MSQREYEINDSDSDEMIKVKISLANKILPEYLIKVGKKKYENKDQEIKKIDSMQPDLIIEYIKQNPKISVNTIFESYLMNAFTSSLKSFVGITIKAILPQIVNLGYNDQEIIDDINAENREDDIIKKIREKEIK